MAKGVIFDYNRTIYDPDTHALSEGALEVLAVCRERHLRMSLISTGDSSRSLEIEQLGIAHFFDKIIIVPKDKGEEKTRGHFEECARAMGLPYHHIAVVGDRVRSEIRLGNALGMHTYWYKRGKYAAEEPSAKEEHPEHTITSLAELLRSFHSLS